MSKRPPIDITLGGKTFTIRPLTMGQLIQVESALMNSALASSGLGLAISVIKAGLSRDHAADVLDDIEAPMSDLNAAMNAVLSQGGFEPSKQAAA